MKRFILLFCSPISLCLMCTVLFAVLVLLESASDRREEKTNLFNQLYRIEPKSLLDDLEQGKIDVFSPIDEEPPWPHPDQQIPVPWTQEDYLRITNTLFEFVWNDTLNGWQLNDMSFSLGCTKYNIGLQSGSFTFFKNEEINGNKTRVERRVNIDPRDKTIYVTEDKYYPRLVDWSSIDLTDNQLSANEILQIAEDAGGRTKRLSVENACHISILLSPDSAGFKGWWIRYSQSGNDATLFLTGVDPSTGEVNTP
jgi:hypothetical protein